MSAPGGARWAAALAALLLLALGLGLGVVWCGIERYDLAYKLTALRAGLDEREELVAKLEVERDNLLSPYRLREKAREFGLGPAGQGRIRRMDAPPAGAPGGSEQQ
ncbi:hypothetical protein [Desulfocurvus sp.]|uniref:hypothetical protein n=1 Tax=Desulfocurvus sp. TaxID=2871698 RepID=UPI0025BA53CC|nr:hypothetical protein [Desulfocurvus sp.]MCK9238845.1 hypothetical protein [Desulfocurvus sp.]